MIQGNTVGASAPQTNYNTTDPNDPGYLIGRETLAKVIQTAENALPRTGGTMGGSIDMSGKSVTNVADPNEAKDAANRGYVDGKHLTPTITVPASGWSGSAAPYTQTVSAAGILETDNPHYTVVYGTSASDRAAQREAFVCIDLLETAKGSVTLTCFDTKPGADLELLLEVNR